jgi:hypothetical protein
LTLFGCFGTAFGDYKDDELDLDDDQGDNMKCVCPDKNISIHFNRLSARDGFLILIDIVDS